MIDLASIGAALASAKTIFELLKNAKDAQLAVEIRNEVSNIQGKLIDVQQQTLSLQSENMALREEISGLKAKLAETVEAEPCPHCLRKGWHVESSKPDEEFGIVGGSRRIYKCSFCGFTESKIV